MILKSVLHSLWRLWYFFANLTRYLPGIQLQWTYIFHNFQVLECLRGTSPSSSATGSPRRETPTDEIESGLSIDIESFHLYVSQSLIGISALYIIISLLLSCTEGGVTKSSLSEATLSWQEIDRSACEVWNDFFWKRFCRAVVKIWTISHFKVSKHLQRSRFKRKRFIFFSLLLLYK